MKQPLKVTHTIDRCGTKIIHPNNRMAPPVLQDLGPVMKAAALEKLLDNKQNNKQQTI